MAKCKAATNRTTSGKPKDHQAKSKQGQATTRGPVNSKSPSPEYEASAAFSSALKESAKARDSRSTPRLLSSAAKPPTGKVLVEVSPLSVSTLTPAQPPRIAAAKPVLTTSPSQLEALSQPVQTTVPLQAALPVLDSETSAHLNSEATVVSSLQQSASQRQQSEEKIGPVSGLKVDGQVLTVSPATNVPGIGFCVFDRGSSLRFTAMQRLGAREVLIILQARNPTQT